jgi:hypothetical protein
MLTAVMPASNASFGQDKKIDSIQLKNNRMKKRLKSLLCTPKVYFDV